MTKPLHFLLLLVCLGGLIGQPLRAQQGNGFFRGFKFQKENKRSLVLNFKLVNNLIVIPVKINNSDTLNFILDSGINNTLITELGVADNLRVKYIKEIKLSGLGSGVELYAYASPNNDFTISGIVGRNQDLLILKEDVFHLSNRFGMRIHGIIGYEMFSDFVIKINYRAKSIVFYKKEKFRYRKRRKDVIVPIEIVETKPYIKAKLKQSNGVEVPVKLLIDTGGSHALWVNVESDERLTIPQKNKEAYLGRGLRGDINGHLGRSSSLKIGKVELKDITTAYPDSISIASVRDEGGRNGSIGSEVLRRFDVIFDYADNKMILRPNSALKEKFNYNMAGVEISNPVHGQPIYTVSHIEPGSDASKLNIQIHDQLTHINGVSVYNYTIHDIYALFRSKEGKKIRLTLQRSGNIKDRWTIEFRLKNPI